MKRNVDVILSNGEGAHYLVYIPLLQRFLPRHAHRNFFWRHFNPPFTTTAIATETQEKAVRRSEKTAVTTGASEGYKAVYRPRLG